MPHGNRKPQSERLRQRVGILLRDEDYLELIETAPARGVSEWCREVILEKLAQIRAKKAS